MASLIFSSDTLRVNLLSERLEVVQRIRDKNGDRSETRQVPLFDIDRVVVIGTPAISMPALTRLMDRGIPCFFVTNHGHWRGTLTPDNNLNAGRRIRQYEQGTDSGFALKVSKALIYAKLRNSRRVLQRLAANRGQTETPEHIHASQAILSYAQEVTTAESVDIIRGLEGLGAALYFNRLGDYFPAQMPFPKRTRRPPRDPANALFSFGYTILLGEMEGAIRSHGLDAGIGCLHTDKLNTPSLALDLIEPLRAPIIDLLILNIVNHLIIAPSDHFEINPEDGGTYLNAEGRKSFFCAYEQAMCRRFSLSRETQHTDLRHVIDDQVVTYLKLLERNSSGRILPPALSLFQNRRHMQNCETNPERTPFEYGIAKTNSQKTINSSQYERIDPTAVYKIGISCAQGIPRERGVSFMLHLVAYDICEPKRLRLAAKACEDFGIRIEKSVFECDLTSEDFALLWERLNKTIDPDEDSLIAYPVCRSCVKNIQSAGIIERPSKRIMYLF